MKQEEYPDIEEFPFYPNKEESILGLLDGLDIRSILDVGAGHGGVFAYGYWDSRNDMEKREACDLAYCRPMSANWKVDVGVDAQRLADAYPPQSFDLVQCMETLEHMPRPIDAIEQMLLVAKKIVIITSASVGHHLGPEQEAAEKWNPHLKYIAQPSIDAMKKLGMEVRVANMTKHSQLIAWKRL